MTAPAAKFATRVPTNDPGALERGHSSFRTLHAKGITKGTFSVSTIAREPTARANLSNALFLLCRKALGERRMSPFLSAYGRRSEALNETENVPILGAAETLLEMGTFSVFGAVGV